MTNDQRIHAAIVSLETSRRDSSAAKFLEELRRALELCIDLRLWDRGKDVIAISVEAWSDGLFAHDDVFVLIYYLCRFHTEAGESSEVIGLYIQGANYFADFNAFQSAYRLLNDAEVYGRELELGPSLLEIKEAVAIIAMVEGDLPYAERAFSEIQLHLADLGLAIPNRLLAHIGTLKMRQRHFGSAADAFRQILVQEEEPETRRAVMLNYSACLRELGKIDEATLTLSEARALMDPDTPLEQRIEFDLIEALTAARADDFGTLLSCLRSAVARIDEMLLPSGRLHYRRGIRERYRRRIAALICELPSQGQSAPLLRVFAFLKSNSFSDWMTLLAWHDQVLQSSETPGELRDRLSNAISTLAAAGTPALYGYREKYDDPWEPHGYINPAAQGSIPDNSGLPWTELNNVIREITARTSAVYPWHDADSETLASHLASRLEQLDSLLVIQAAGDTMHVFVLIANSYSRHDFQMTDIIEFLHSLSGFQDGTEARSGYMDKLVHCVGVLSKALAADFDTIASGGCERIVILPDPFEIPLLATLMAHAGLRMKARGGRLAVSVCPVLHVRADDSCERKSITACFYSEDELALNEEEVAMVSRILSPAAVEVVSLPSPSDWQTILSADVVHIVGHGASVSNFRDAFFATPHLNDYTFTIQTLQAISWRTLHKIVFLNSCFSGSSINWNVFRNFSTNEQIGLPTTLLLNRRAAVIAALWKTFDVTGFIFAQLFYINVVGGLETAKVFTKAVADLADMNSEQVWRALELIQDQGMRARKQQSLSAEENPFRHPYISGTYQFSCLL